MEKSIVWEIINSFSQKELKEFNLFLHSPLNNKRKDLIKANDVLTRFAILHKKAPTKKRLFVQIFPDEPFNDQKLRLTSSRLHKVLERFLIFKEVKNLPFESEKLLISAYRSRKLVKNYKQSQKNVNKAVAKQSLRNPMYFSTKFFFEYQNSLFISETSTKSDFNINDIDKNIDKNLTIAFIGTKLRQACFVLSYQTVSSDKYDITLMNEVMELAQQAPFKDLATVSIYYNFLVLYQSGTWSDYERFKKELFLNVDKFIHEEFRDIYLAAINFCIKQINKNQLDYISEALELYKKGLELQLLSRNGELSKFTFNNIVGIALKLNESLWVKHFIRKYKKQLPRQDRIITYNLNMARLEFFEKNYKKALIFLQRADYDSFLNLMTAKILQMKIYYELDEFDTLNSLLKSMLIFLRRKKKIGYHYQIWKNTITYVQKLLAVNGFDKQAVALLKKKIKNERVIMERDWLLEKLDIR